MERLETGELADDDNAVCAFYTGSAIYSTP